MKLQMTENLTKAENTGYQDCKVKGFYIRRKISVYWYAVIHSELLNSLPNNKFLDWSKLREFAGYKLNLVEKLKFVLGRVGNIAGKGENAGFQHFLLSPHCFQKASFSRWFKVEIVW